MPNRTNTSKKTVKLTTTAILTALLLVMTFTPLGYLKTPVVEISFLTIPVAIGAITLGPAVGAWLGFLFGITSYAQCFMGAPLGTILVGISPWRMFIVCVVPRVLVGLLCGLIFSVFKNKLNNNSITCGISSISAAVLNTILFLSTMGLLFYSKLDEMSEGIGVLKLLISWAGWNAVFEAIACGIIATAIAQAIYAAFKKLNIAE